MTTMLRAAMLFAMTAACLPALAEGQKSSGDSLLHRIASLERQAADLDQRVRALEALIAVEPSRAQPVPESAKWQDLANWRRLRRGMKSKEVLALLGTPARVEAGYITHWYWTDRMDAAHVYFADGKLDGWSEP